MALKAVNDDFIEYQLKKRDELESRLDSQIEAGIKKAKEQKSEINLILKIPTVNDRSGFIIEKFDYNFNKPQKLRYWINKMADIHKLDKVTKFKVLKEAEKQIHKKTLCILNDDYIDPDEMNRNQGMYRIEEDYNFNLYFDSESEGESIQQGFEVYDFLKKKCEFCGKLGFNTLKQCKSCKITLKLTTDCKEKSKAYNYSLKFLEQFLFFFSFLDKKFVFNILPEDIKSLNKFSWFIDEYIEKTYTDTDFKTLLRHFIKKFTQSFLSCDDDDFVIEDEEREGFDKMFLEITSLLTKEENIEYENNFVLKMKPKSKRGAHLIGIGRNIKYLKRRQEQEKQLKRELDAEKIKNEDEEKNEDNN